MLKGNVLRLARLKIFLESDFDIKFYKQISELSEKVSKNYESIMPSYSFYVCRKK